MGERVFFIFTKAPPKSWLLNKPGKEFGRLRDFLSLSPGRLSVVCQCEKENGQVIELTPELGYVPTPWPELALDSLTCGL